MKIFWEDLRDSINLILNLIQDQIVGRQRNAIQRINQRSIRVAVNVTAGWTDQHSAWLSPEKLFSNMAATNVLSPISINDKKSG